jgi:hypothetical protein
VGDLKPPCSPKPLPDDPELGWVWPILSLGMPIDTDPEVEPSAADPYQRSTADLVAACAVPVAFQGYGQTAAPEPAHRGRSPPLDLPKDQRQDHGSRDPQRDRPPVDLSPRIAQPDRPPTFTRRRSARYWPGITGHVRAAPTQLLILGAQDSVGFFTYRHRDVRA